MLLEQDAASQDSLLAYVSETPGERLDYYAGFVLADTRDPRPERARSSQLDSLTQIMAQGGFYPDFDSVEIAIAACYTPTAGEECAALKEE